MIDIHTHLIPGVDDGSWNLDMSQSMMVSAMLQGTQAFFVTPHSAAFEVHPNLVRENDEALRRYLLRLRIPVPIYLGCEVLCEPDSICRVLDRLQTGQYPTMNGSGYVLTEFAPSVAPQEAMAMVQALMESGWKIILAHVERYAKLFEDFSVNHLTEMGCLLQMNAYSLVEEENTRIRSNARWLLEHEKATFLGSDTHRLNHRPPSIASGLQYIHTKCRREYAEDLISGNAQRLLIGK